MSLFTLPRLDWISLALALLFGVFLVWWELRKKRPFIDVRLLAKNMALTRTYARFEGLALCIYAMMYGLPEWLEVSKGFSASITGLLVLPMSAVSAVMAWLVSRKNMDTGFSSSVCHVCCCRFHRHVYEHLCALGLGIQERRSC